MTSEEVAPKSLYVVRLSQRLGSSPWVHRIRNDLKQIGTVGFILYVAVVILLQMSPILLLGGVLSGGSIGADEALGLVDVFMVSFPLSVATTMISYQVIRGRIGEDTPETALVRILGPMLLGIGLSTTYGLTSVDIDWAPPEPPLWDYVRHNRAGRVLGGILWVGWLLVEYVTAFGPSLFLASIAVGTYCGWILAAKIRPLLQHLA